jgi:antitoxin component HigA of HigAB toxin-antitoxin module
MIRKEPDYKKAIECIDKLLATKKLSKQLSTDLILERAGIHAEKQMAYKLKCYFSGTNDLHVINNLKIEHNHATAQIDHLVLSQRAVFFIESKSISDTITVNESGEWARRFRGKYTPISSPVEQVRTQKKVLFDFLKVNVSNFLGKFLGLQKGVKAYTPYLFVAISEKGWIKGKGRAKFKNVKKFDQICPEIEKTHLTGSGIMKSFLSEKDENFNVFSQKELSTFADFLLEHDTSIEPLEKIRQLVKKHQVKKIPAKLKAKPKEKKPPFHTLCAHCDSANINIAFARSYYIKCLDCGKNTPIKEICDKCNKMMRTQKKGQKFYLVCKNCDFTHFFFENKE